MKILITPDVMDWAIGALTRSIIRHSDHRFDYTIVPVHPRASTSPALKIRQLIKEGNKFDLWHCMYWHSGSELLKLLPELREIPSIVSHHNHYALEKESWEHYDAITIPTTWGDDFLKRKYDNVTKIPYGIDLDRFSYIEERKDDKKTIGYVGRVIAHKNLGKITFAAKELGYRVLGTGFIEKPDYWQTVDKTNLEFYGGQGRQGMTPQARKDNLYEEFSVFVMYSTGEVETGTVPLLEAMARGVPVMATSQGMARDLIEDGKNGIIFTEENFQEKLDMLMKDRDLQERLRQNAWKTIRKYPEERMSLEYQKLYAKVLSKGKPRISVIVPTKDRPEQLIDSLVNIDGQDYKYKEIIVCDNGSKDQRVQTVINESKRILNTPIIHLRVNSDDRYGLGLARNRGIIEALGEIVVFIDDRLKMEMGTLNAIAQRALQPKTFYWGEKLVDGQPSTKKAFVENFSWCRKSDIVEAGMFAEWLQYYGGMSEEIRTRLTKQNWRFEYNDGAKASQMVRSSRSNKKSDIWKAKWLLRKIYDK